MRSCTEAFRVLFSDEEIRVGRLTGVLAGVAGLLASIFLLFGCDQGGPVPNVEDGDSTVVNSVGIRLRRIPAGSFLMGSVDGQNDEIPVHEVEISEPFYIGVHEVTQLQWEIVMDQNPSHFRGAHRPVDSVSWRQARTFIRRLNEREETELYRLPTEAEWEYAARGGSDTRYHYGDGRDSLRIYAWYSFNSERRTHRVGRKRKNPFGLFDIYGNVWEWIYDAYDGTFYERSSGVDPVNTPGLIAPRRVIRGGGWFAVVSDLRSANRGWARPGAQNEKLGFRIVREIPAGE